LEVGLQSFPIFWHPSAWKTTDYVRFERRLWRAISILFVALGENRQLDLQTARTEFGPMIAFDQGWYDARRNVQLLFIAEVAL
jgi:hypothetical protein